MRVLEVLSAFKMGGAERNVVSLAPALATRGVRPLVVGYGSGSQGGLRDQLVATEIDHAELGAHRLLDPGALARLRRLVRAERVAIVHSHDQYGHLLGAYLRATTRVGFVLSRNVTSDRPSSRRERIRARLVYWAARHAADVVVTNAEAIRRTFAAQAHVPEARIRVIHNWVDLDAFAPRDPEVARAALGWPRTAPTVVMLSVLRPGKGHEVLLRAIPEIAAVCPGVVLRIAGAGPLEARLRADVGALRARAQVDVDLVGEVHDVPSFLAAADVVVLPSWSEGLPTSLLEAGAQGKPVVATSVGGTAEAVVDGQTGYLVAPGDHEALAERIVGLLADPAAAAAMGERGRARVAERFSLGRAADETVAAYEAARR